MFWHTFEQQLRHPALPKNISDREVVKTNALYKFLDDRFQLIYSCFYLGFEDFSVDKCYLKQFYLGTAVIYDHYHFIAPEYFNLLSVVIDRLVKDVDKSIKKLGEDENNKTEIIALKKDKFNILAKAAMIFHTASDKLNNEKSPFDARKKDFFKNAYFIYAKDYLSELNKLVLLDKCYTFEDLYEIALSYLETGYPLLKPYLEERIDSSRENIAVAFQACRHKAGFIETLGIKELTLGENVPLVDASSSSPDLSKKYR